MNEEIDLTQGTGAEEVGNMPINPVQMKENNQPEGEHVPVDVEVLPADKTIYRKRGKQSIYFRRDRSARFEELIDVEETNIAKCHCLTSTLLSMSNGNAPRDVLAYSFESIGLGGNAEGNFVAALDIDLVYSTSGTNAAYQRLDNVSPTTLIENRVLTMYNPFESIDVSHRWLRTRPPATTRMEFATCSTMVALYMQANMRAENR